jgi:hypothetical protein
LFFREHALFVLFTTRIPAGFDSTIPYVIRFLTIENLTTISAKIFHTTAFSLNY